MKNFFGRLAAGQERSLDKDRESPGQQRADGKERAGQVDRALPARLAVYDSPRAAPRVVELTADDYEEFMNVLATKTYQLSKEAGGGVPFTIIKDAIENLIHALFKEVVISVLDEGNTVRISDQGPGIQDKEKAFEPGFSTATTGLKGLIKGVGSGLPIIKETVSFLGGVVTIDDNLEAGTVLTISVPKKEAAEASAKEGPEEERPVEKKLFRLAKRQKQVLFIVTELASVGPSKVATELGVSLSTAYRDLIYLEKQGLIQSGDQGKRALTSQGIEYLDDILKS